MPQAQADAENEASLNKVEGGASFSWHQHAGMLTLRFNPAQVGLLHSGVSSAADHLDMGLCMREQVMLVLTLRLGSCSKK